jgi:hypothetical protein
MKHYVEHVKDAIGQNYLGIKIDKLEVLPLLDKLRSILGKEEYDLYTGNQQTRDHGAYHMTVINAMDYGRLTKSMGMDKFVAALQPIFEYEIDDLEMLGVGKAESKGNAAYFVVCQSDKLVALRDRFELPKHDFHITLGFDKKDVFGVPKNEIIKF